MLICNKCGEVFSTPEYHKGDEICPGCGGRYFDEAVRCASCGEWIAMDEAYGYGHKMHCMDCINKHKEDIDFLGKATEDAQDIEIPMLYRYIFSDDDIKSILYRAAKEKLERGEFDATEFIKDYANDIADAIGEEL